MMKRKRVGYVAEVLLKTSTVRIGAFTYEVSNESPEDGIVGVMPVFRYKKNARAAFGKSVRLVEIERDDIDDRGRV